MNWTFTWRKTVSPKEFYEVFLYHSLDARAIFSRVTHYKNRRYIQYRGDWHAFDQAIRNNPEAFCQIVLAEHLL